MKIVPSQHNHKNEGETPTSYQQNLLYQESILDFWGKPSIGIDGTLEEFPMSLVAGDKPYLPDPSLEHLVYGLIQKFEENMDVAKIQQEHLEDMELMTTELNLVQAVMHQKILLQDMDNKNLVNHTEDNSVL